MSNGPTSGAPVALVVLDGWGFREERDGNAIELGHTPVWHGLWAVSYTHLTLPTIYSV